MEVEKIVGAKKLIEWFGRWPTFHDAEVSELHLCRNSISQLKIVTWNMTRALDSNGYYIQEKRVLVTFLLEKITEVFLQDFNHQNVISHLSINEIDSGVELELHPCFGLNGKICAESVSIAYKPCFDTSE